MKKNNYTVYIVLGIFAILGVYSLIMGVSMFISNAHSKATTEQVSAEISGISEQKNSKGELSYFVFVDYDYEGVEYKDISLGVYVATMYEGKEIEILVNPEEPTDIKLTGQDTVDALGGVFGGVICLVVGLVPLIILLKRNKKVKAVIEAGYYIYATVYRIEKNYNSARGGRHPFVAYCSYEDEMTGAKHKFKSPEMWKDPYPVIQEGTRLKVYVDRQNYTNYYVDIDSLF